VEGANELRHTLAEIGPQRDQFERIAKNLQAVREGRGLSLKQATDALRISDCA
jgi:hypothetical protein